MIKDKLIIVFVIIINHFWKYVFVVNYRFSD